MAEPLIRTMGIRAVNPPRSRALAQVRPSHQNTLAETMVLLGVILYLVVPANLLLTIGIPYNVPGGSLLLKFHPASYLTLLAFLLMLKDESERRRMAQALRDMPILGVFPVVLIVVMAYTTLQFGTSGVGFYIDTFFIAAILGLVLITRPDRFNQRLYVWIVSLTVLSSLLALTESATEARLLPYLLDGEPAKEDFFRSAALAAHPLEAAQRTIVVLFTAWVLPQPYRMLVMTLLFLSLLAFGSRTAFAISGLFLAMGGGILVFRAMLARRLNPRWVLIGVMLGTVLMVASILLAWKLDLGTRIFEKIYLDESAVSRLESIELLEELDPDQFWLGSGAEGVTALMLARRGWFNIENFWVVLLIQLGIFLFLFMAPALLGFFYRLARQGPVAVRVAALAYLIVASSNDALSHKTPNLVIMVAALVGASAYSRMQPVRPTRVNTARPLAALRKLQARPPR